MKDETFYTILHMAVKIHEINSSTPGRSSFSRDYLDHMKDIKERYDDWCGGSTDGESEPGEDD